MGVTGCRQRIVIKENKTAYGPQQYLWFFKAFRDD